MLLSSVLAPFPYPAQRASELGPRSHKCSGSTVGVWVKVGVLLRPPDVSISAPGKPVVVFSEDVNHIMLLPGARWELQRGLEGGIPLAHTDTHARTMLQPPPPWLHGLQVDRRRHRLQAGHPQPPWGPGIRPPVHPASPAGRRRPTLSELGEERGNRAGGSP